METPRFTVRNESFQCVHCGAEVLPSATGCRNHCPVCFYSVHLDVFPGDRASDCGGKLEPVGIETNSKKGYMVIHQCNKCGHRIKNKLNLEDPVQPDSFERMLDLMRKPPIV